MKSDKISQQRLEAIVYKSAVQNSAQIAIVADAETWTYRDLIEYSEKVAHLLLAYGVRRGDTVGLSATRQPETIACLLGIMRVGAKYLPIDPACPLERLRFIIDDAGLKLLLLSTDITVSAWADTGRVTRISYKEITGAGKPDAGRDFDVHGGTADDEAYILYTSGSSGRPKGVLIRHRNIINFLLWAREALGDSALKYVLASTSFTFDISAVEIWLPLIAGGTIVLVQEASKIHELKTKNDITLINTVPSVMIETLTRGKLPNSLKTVCLGGEALPKALVDAVYDNSKVERVFNLYGPTETTVYSSYKLITRDKRNVSIGNPIAHTSLYILDEHLKPVPQGETGELYIGGAGVGVGYLNRPDLTARNFVPDPFAANDKTTMYRTGDLSRLNDEGEFEFFGRIDHQVKLHGYRIELGEIETLLNEYKGITHSIVELVKGPTGDDVLAAFLLSPRKITHLKALREYLRKYLPAPMLPAVFVQLEKLPLTSSGKLDRRRLPDPFANITSKNKRDSPAVGDNLLDKIWKEILSITEFNKHADFFSLGGHSLMAGRLLSRVYDETGVSISLKEFLSSPLLSSLKSLVKKRKRKTDPTMAPHPEPLNWDSRYRPLSLNQEGIWFLNQLNPGSTEYNISWNIVFNGVIDLTAMNSAVSALFRKHEIFKMGFLSNDGKPLGFLETLENPVVNTLDLRQIPLEHRQQSAREFLAKEAACKFDLSKPPLFRVGILMQENEAVISLTVHHIIADGWSMTVLERELHELYDIFRHNGVAQPEDKEKLTFFDYAAWQRKRLTGEVQTKQIEYWKNRLKTIPNTLDLLPDEQQKTDGKSKAGLLYFRLPEELGKKLENVGAKYLATPFTTFLASLQLLLFRYTGQKNACIGTVVSNREASSLNDIIGLFVNTIAIKADIDPEESFKELLRTTRDRVLEGFDNKDVPFDRIVAAVNPERRLGHSPIFQVMFTLNNVAGNSPDSTEAPFRGLRPDYVFTFAGNPENSIEIYKSSGNNPAKFQLTVTLQHSEHGYLAVLEFDEEKFNAGRMARLLGNWLVLINGITDNPDCPVNLLPILTDHERELADRWRREIEFVPDSNNLISAFQESVNAFPAKIAIRDKTRTLTYKQLDEQSNAWANSLLQKGITAGDTIAIASQRSAATIQAFLAVLKIGATYLPISPDDPPLRNEFILSDSGAKLILTDAAEHNGLKITKAPVVNFADLDGSDSAPNGTTRKVNDVAYLMYTSGSTGTPKGVEVCDRGIIRLVRRQKYAVLNNDEVFSQISTLTFDASTFEIWAALLNGGTLNIAMPKRMSLVEICDYFQAEKITTAFLTTSLFNQLVDEQLDRLASLKQIITGGDVMSPPHSGKLLKKHNHIHLVNAYGPTEGSAFTTCYPIDAGNFEFKNFVPIGYPLNGTTVDLFDEAGQLVPKGAVGEIYIGGDGIAKGYRNREALTKNSFIQNPAYPDERCYRSGDLGRFLEDNSLQFLGRKDSQIKIRGYRVEVGEVESKLITYKGISRSVVVAVPVQQEKQLVAYLKLDSESKNLKLGDLRKYLTTLLPEYMLPSHYVIVDEFPLTSTGKLDLKQLPPIEIAPDENFQPPETEMERLVAHHFEKFLGVAPIGKQGNFFELGGHSLLATRLLARLRSELNVNMSLEVFFDTQTVSLVASYLQALQKKQDVSAPTGIKKKKRPSEPSLSFAQQRLWFLERLHPDQGAYTILSTRVVESLNIDVLTKAQNEMIRRHESLRTVFSIGESGDPFQNVLPLEESSVRQLDYGSYSLFEKEAALRHFLKLEATRKFDLATGPLFTMTAIKLDDERSLLAATFHHIISDGWSMDIFWSEIHEIYCAFSEKLPNPLPPLDAQYVDFTYWQKEIISGEVLKKQLDYWRGIIGWVPPIVKLPTSVKQEDEDDFQSTTLGISLSSQQRLALEKIANEEKASLFMILATAFYALVYRYTGNPDICIGIPLANRRIRETESMIGFFVNTLPLRIDLSGSPTFRELLLRVRERVLGAFANQDVPFEKIVEELHAGRHGTKNAFFDMMFSFQTSSRKGFNLSYQENIDDESRAQQPHSEIIKRGNEAGVAKFSISLATVVGDTIELWLEFKNKLYEEQFISRFLKNLSVLISSAIASPNMKIEELPILSEEERRQLIVEWNQRERVYDREASLLDYVEEQAKKTPEAAALISDDGVLSYRDLIISVNKMAHYLQSLGARKGDIIALCVNRSAEMVISQMAIMKIGAAYVPIDPLFPPDRVRYMLKDSNVSIVVIHAANGSAIPKGKWKTYALEKIKRDVSGQPEIAPNVAVGGRDVCYVMYTSGSTGRPNGAVLEHRGVANCVLWMQDKYNINADDRILLKESYCYDATVWETFWALFNGAAVVIAAADRHLDGEYLSDLINKWKVTVIYSVSSLLPFLYEEMDVEKCKSIKHIFCGGEALSPKVMRRHYSLFDAPLHNWYGPTEVSIGTVAWTCREDFGGHSLPIGKPINNVRAYITDQNRQLVPVGVSGELWLAGISVGRGYLKNKKLTAEKIIEDPFTDNEALNYDDRRTYRTGDLTQYDMNGNIEYLGRIDNQVKIRGQRIEIGEIYSVIEKQIVIKESYITTKEINGAQELVSYVVWNESINDSIIPEVRNNIRSHLPEFMVPIIFSIAEMPHMENGKVDPNKLPELDLLSKQDTESYIAPQDPLEEFITKQFITLLKLEKIGLHDDFFLLGGHSLLAAKLIARLCKAFEIDLPLKAVFEDRTVFQLSTRIKNLVGRQAADGGKKPIRKCEWKDHLRPLSYEQQRMWFLSNLTGHSSVYNVTKIIWIDGYADADRIKNCLLHLAERHEQLRAVFSNVGGRLFSQVLPPENSQIDLSVENLSSFSVPDADERFDILCSQQFLKNFTMDEKPVWRALLVYLPSGNSALVVNLHHIIFDSWSGEIFSKEFHELYKAEPANQKLILPSLEIQYSDYANWQQQTEDLSSDLSYWENEMRNVTDKLYFSSPGKRSTTQMKFDAVELIIKGEPVISFDHLCKSVSVTPFIGFLASWIIALSRITKSETVTIGTPVSLRNRPEIQGLIGLFLNTFVLSEKINPEVSLKDYLTILQRKFVSHLSHSGVPYEKIVDHIRKRSGGFRKELFDTFFAHETKEEKIDFKGYQLMNDENSYIKYLSTEAVKFPLSLHALETGNLVKLTFEFDRSNISEKEANKIVSTYKTIFYSLSTQATNTPLGRFLEVEQV